MRWEEITGDEFAGAIEQSEGVCLVPLSVIERHGHHLPLGTDMFIGRAACDRSAAIEPALVFPDFYLTQIPEARHAAGTISVDGDLILKLLDSVCREISRNGLKKIVLVNAHGGNTSLLRYFNELQLYSPRDYVVYSVHPSWLPGERPQVPWDPASDSHAGAGETSIILATHPHLVHMDQVPSTGEGVPQGRLKAFGEAGISTGIWWYADHPTHYGGDATPATAEAGDALLNYMAGALARVVRMIKDDTVTPALLEEFYRDSSAPRQQFP